MLNHITDSATKQCVVGTIMYSYVGAASLLYTNHNLDLTNAALGHKHACYEEQCADGLPELWRPPSRKSIHVDIGF